MDSKLKCDLSDAVDLSSEGLPFVLTNAGCWPKEDNDCAVVALSIATNLPYRVIHKILKVFLGRKNKCSTPNFRYAHSWLPFKLSKVSRKPFKLGTLPKRYPKGRYYVQIGGYPTKGIDGVMLSCHATALIDGKIHDRHVSSPDRWVQGVWKVRGLKANSWNGWKIIKP